MYRQVPTSVGGGSGCGRADISCPIRRDGARRTVSWSARELRPFKRGQLVVIETVRGVELGEVLTAVETSARREGIATMATDGKEAIRLLARHDARVLKSCARRPSKKSREQNLAQERTGNFELCQRALQQFDWPWAFIDVEALLDDRTLVLHYLGPHQLDSAEVRAWFRTVHDVDVIFEPVGADESSQTSDAPGLTGGHGCGSSGCGNGGCGSGVEAENASAESIAHGCGTSSHSGCSSCGIMRAMTERNQRNGGHHERGSVTSSRI